MYVHLLSNPEQCKDGTAQVDTLPSKSYSIGKIPKNSAIRHHRVRWPRLSNLAIILPRKCTLLLLIVHHGSHDQPPSIQVLGSGDSWLLKGSDVVNMISFAFCFGLPVQFAHGRLSCRLTVNPLQIGEHKVGCCYRLLQVIVFERCVGTHLKLVCLSCSEDCMIEQPTACTEEEATDRTAKQSWSIYLLVINSFRQGANLL